MNPTQHSPTFAILTLGCKVNQYESEAITEALEAKGCHDGDTVSIYDFEFDYVK